MTNAWPRAKKLLSNTCYDQLHNRCEGRVLSDDDHGEDLGLCACACHPVKGWRRLRVVRRDATAPSMKIPWWGWLACVALLVFAMNPGGWLVVLFLLGRSLVWNALVVGAVILVWRKVLSR